MFHFYWPWFALLIPLPLLVRLLSPSASKKGMEEIPLLRFPALNRLKQAFPSSQIVSKKANKTTTVLLSLVWISVIIALMQPEKVDHYTQVHNVGHDIMLAVDISPSMKALDFSTKQKVINRLDVTKDVVGKFVRGRQGDRVGLIIFGENAYQHVPLTLDTVSVGKMLNDTVAGMAGPSTAIGDAIGMSIRTLRERPEDSRVLILLTDGDDNASKIPPVEAAKLAKQYGIRIYTIGVGTKGSVPFPTDFGGYQMVQMSFDESLLIEVATMTGGEYFHATDQSSLQQIYDKIDALEKTEANTEEIWIREPLYQYPLGFALVLLLLILLGPIYRSVAHGL
jgi:Ca-activated chloride channel homolog